MKNITKSKSGKIRKKESKICKHYSSIKINSQLNLCNGCGKITYFQKIQNKITTKYLIKPKNYLQPIDFSPIESLKKLTKQDFSNIIGLHYSNFYLDIRTKQIQIIHSLNKTFNSDPSILYLSIYNLDRIFSTLKFQNLKEQKTINLLTICCFIVTYKYLAIDNYKYHLDLPYIRKKFNVTKADIFLYELKCLKRLDYNLNLIDIYGIIKIIMYTGFIFNDENLGDTSIHSIYKSIKHLLSDVIFEEKILKKFSNKQIAFSIIYLTRKKFGLNEKTFINEITENIYNYEFHNYKKCVNFIENFFDKENKTIIFNTILSEEDLSPQPHIKDNVTFLSPIKTSSLNSERTIQLSKSLKPVKLKGLFKKLNNNNSQVDINESTQINSPVSKENEDNQILKMIPLKNKENLRHLVENQKTKLSKVPSASRNSKKIKFSDTEEMNENKSLNNVNVNKLLKVAKSQFFHTRVLSEDITGLQKLRDIERIKLNMDTSPKDELSKRNYINTIHDINCFNKSLKNNHNENVDNKFKLIIPKNKKLENIVFPYLN